MGAPYADHEDVASFVSLREERGAPKAFPPVSALGVFGPQAESCRAHAKAIMISYWEKGAVRELYLDGERAAEFIEAVERVKKALSLRPLLFSFKTAIGKEEKNFIVDRKCLRALFRSVGLLREALAVYRMENPDEARAETPVREGPPAQAEMEKLRRIYERSAKPEPRNISLEGIDKGVLLALLYNNSKTVGEDFEDLSGGRSAGMIPAEGGHLFAEIERLGVPPYFDQVNCHPIQSCFSRLAGRPVLSVSNYWGQTGTPVMVMLPLAKRGIYIEGPGKGFRSYKEEALSHCALLCSMAQKIGHMPPADDVLTSVDRIFERCVAETTLRMCFEEQKEAYNEAMRDARAAPTFYQISLFGCDPKEIGHVIRPFVPRPELKLLKNGPAPG